MKISVMNGNEANFEPVVIDGLGGLVQKITESDYSLGTFANNHRNNENFQGSHFLGLDFDDTMSMNEAQQIFKDYKHIIATTRNHQKLKNGIVCDRFRVILSADRFIDNKEDYTATIISLLNLYPQADKACKDAARFFYASGIVVSTNETGKNIPVVKYTAPEKKERMDSPEFIKGPLAKSTLDFIAFGSNSGAWNHAIHKAARDCHQQNYNVEETLHLLEKASLDFDGCLDEKDIASIKSAFSNEPKHETRGIEGLIDLTHPLDIAKKAGNMKWLVDGLFQADGLYLMAGPPKAGKSTLTRQLAMAVARGGDFLGRKCAQEKVIYLALEETESLLGEQLKKIGIKAEDPIMMKVGPIMDPEPAQMLRRTVEATGAGLVVIDTMLLMTGIEDINNYNQVYKALSPYRDMARETGCGIVMIHHKNKGLSTRADAAAGSTALSAAVDCTFVLNETNNAEYRFINTSQRGGRPFSNQKIKYLEDLDMYEISNETYQGDF